METKGKIQALSQGSWQLLHAPIAPLIHISISNSKPIFLSNPKRGKTHHEWRRRPNEEWESFPKPLTTSKRLSKHPKVFLYRAKWGITYHRKKLDLKPIFWHVSAVTAQPCLSSAQRQVLRIEWCSAPLSTAKPCGAQPQFYTAQPWAVWQYYVFEALGMIPVVSDAGIYFKIYLFLLNHAPLSSCLFSSTTNVSY